MIWVAMMAVGTCLIIAANVGVARDFWRERNQARAERDRALKELARLVGYCDNCGGKGVVGGLNSPWACSWCGPARVLLESIPDLKRQAQFSSGEPTG